MVTPAVCREAVAHLRAGFAMSERGRAVWLERIGRACVIGADGLMTASCRSG
jgi:hypothetical protein